MRQNAGATGCGEDPRRLPDGAARLCAGLLAALLSSCSTTPSHAPATSTPASSPATPDAVALLDRIAYGPTSASLAQLRQLGRERYLAEQLHPSDPGLPPAVAQQIRALRISQVSGETLLAEASAENRRINALPDGPDKEQARKALNERGNALSGEAIRRQLLRAVYANAQLQERMVAFWLNHFSVHQYKAQLRWLVGDYEEEAIRPHVLGHFRDLVMATLTHPAMLQYLDNAQNAAGHVNENYARELLELHTLGVNAGYTQNDVQQLARVLTGVGVNGGGEKPHLAHGMERLYVRRGAFEFNPARHDFSAKQLLGKPVEGNGFAEVEHAVDLIVHQRACAEYISRRLALYWIGEAPARLVTRMADAFARSDGDIAAVMNLLLQSPEFTASLGRKLKDPREYVVSAIRLAYDDQGIVSTRPIVNWLNQLGEAPFGHQTPDGYSLEERAWTSPGQMSRRLEIARAIGSGSAGLFDPEDGSNATITGFPRVEGRLYYAALAPRVSARTRAVLDQATSPQEWNTFFLASPDFNYH